MLRALRAPWARVALALFVIGYGANHFATLLPSYRQHDGLTQTTVSGLFGAYALGLMPALLLAPVLSARVGHRAVVRGGLLVSAATSVLLALSSGAVGALFVERALFGICMGAAMAPGTTWIKELSAGEPTGTGARRAAVALSAGFGGGPVVSGVLAQWLPGPLVLPYLVHLALTVLVIVLVWPVPDPDAHGTPVDAPPPGAHAALGRPFWRHVAPAAPWVFTCASAGVVILPALVGARTGDLTVVFTGLMAGLTLGTGVLVQQPARRHAQRNPGPVLRAGLAATVLGLLLTVLLTRAPQPWLAVPVAVVLGIGYGLVLVGGLTRVEIIAPPAQLALTNAVFYCLTYVGFFVPVGVSALSERWPRPAVLLGLVALAAVTLVTARSSMRIGPASESGREADAG